MYLKKEIASSSLSTIKHQHLVIVVNFICFKFQLIMIIKYREGKEEEVNRTKKRANDHEIYKKYRSLTSI